MKSARAYVAAAGLYELHINGRKVGDHRLDPMYTRFDRRNLYVTYDVTRQLQDGANAVGILLGNGWYNHQSGAVWNFERAPWRNRPAFCFDLRIEYADGTHEVVKSDLDWRTSGGPLVFNSIYTSEHYDARLEQPGWSAPGFDDSAWGGVMYRGAPSQRVTAQQTVPIRNVTEYRPRSVRKLDERSYLYDFGQNMAGVTKLRLRGEAGTQLRLIHAERLREDGHADLSNIDVYFRPTDKDDLFQTDVVTLSGRDDEFMPRFNYKGFRYVEVVADRPVELSAENLTAYAMHSDVTPVGHIETSNDLVDKLWDATNKAYLSNLMGYPTDCPQREKNGWTGDGHLAIATALRSTRSGSPTTATNSSPTACCPTSSPPAAGATARPTGWTGRVPLPSSRGTSTSSTGTRSRWRIATRISNAMSITSTAAARGTSPRGDAATGCPSARSRRWS